MDASMQNRCNIHQKYRGLRGQALNKAAGITDGEFVHQSGFIGGAWSLQSCIKMAEDSIKLHQRQEQSKTRQAKKQSHRTDVPLGYQSI